MDQQHLESGCGEVVLAGAAGNIPASRKWMKVDYFGDTERRRHVFRLSRRKAHVTNHVTWNYLDILPVMFWNEKLAPDYVF